MSKFFITFATDNFSNVLYRIKNLTILFNAAFNIFNNCYFITENTLPSFYIDKFEQFKKDYAYAFWSWKPAIILNLLNAINNNDIIVYMDAGCDIHQNVNLANSINNVCNRLVDDNFDIAIGESPVFNGQCEILIKKEILKDFNLYDDMFFRKTFPHYEAGILFIRKTDTSLNLLKDWWLYFVENYTKSIIFPSNLRNSKENLDSCFLGNNGDLSVLQCLLYKKQIKIINCKDLFYQLNVYSRNK